MERILLPTIVTAYNPNWTAHIEEIKELNIKQIGLFLTVLDSEERKHCYCLLEQIKGLEIPFVHIRTDMTAQELQYLSKTFKAKKFNTHPISEYPFKYDLNGFNKAIFVENSGHIKESDIAPFAGICLDVAHLEDWFLRRDNEYQNVCDLLKRFPVGANHISAVLKEPVKDLDGDFGYSCHFMINFSQFDYLKKYPEEYFGEYLALELVNSIKDQLELIQYIKSEIPFLLQS